MKKSKCKSYIKDLEETIRLMSEERDEFLSEQNDFEDTIKNIQLEIETLKEKHDKEKSTISYCHKSEIQILVDRIQCFENLSNKDKETIQSLEADLDNLRVENDELKKKIVFDKNKIDNIETLVTTLRNDLHVSRNNSNNDFNTIEYLKEQADINERKFNELIKLLHKLCKKG